MTIYSRYQEFTRTTAIYPDMIQNVPGHIGYLPLGLGDEVGELCEKIADFVNQDKTKPPVRKADVMKEVGDVMWYATRFIDSLKLDLDDYATSAYDGVATLEQVAIYLAVKSGVVAGRAKKFIRDGMGENYEKNIVKAIDAIESIIAALRTLCRFFSTTLEEVCYENQAKLQDRKDRCVLQGDGDNR